MQNGLSWLFFVAFAIVLAIMYLAIRRRWAAPGLISGAGVLASIITMVLYSLAQGNNFLHAIVVGILLGAIFSGAVLAAAWYFHNNELRARYASGELQPPQVYEQPQPVAQGDEDY